MTRKGDIHHTERGDSYDRLGESTLVTRASSGRAVKILGFEPWLLHFWSWNLSIFISPIDSAQKVESIRTYKPRPFASTKVKP